MPINVKSQHGGPIAKMQEEVRQKLGLPDDANVAIGMNETYVRKNGITVTVPFGIAALKNGQPMEAVLETLATLVGGAMPMPTFAPNPMPSHEGTQAVVADYDEMSDEEWVEAIAAKTFPDTKPLCQADGLYAPVTGTSSGSVYHVCFMGPELRVACRLKGAKVSFRVTTPSNLAPKGKLLTVFQRLGVVNTYDDRLTVHAQMTGPYSEDTAAEYRALFGAFYAALRPWLTSPFPSVEKLYGKGKG